MRTPDDRVKDLLAGPRGRRVLLEFALASEPLPGESLGAFGMAEFYASYDLDPGRGTSVQMLGGGGHGVLPTYSPEEVAALLDEVPLAPADDALLQRALAGSPDTARYWQEADVSDVHAATEPVRRSLGRVAQHMVEKNFS